MKVFPIPSGVNALVILAQLAAWLGCLVWCAHAETPGSRLGLALVWALVMNGIYATVHEAEHGILFSNRRLNNTVGALLALLFPAAFHLIRQTHLGHHQRNRSDDEAFDLYFETDNRLWKTLVYYGILLGVFYWFAVAFQLVMLLPRAVLRWRIFRGDRPTEALCESLNPRYHGLIRVQVVAAVLLHSTLLTVVGLPWLNYLIMYAGFGWMWSALQYVHHYETERDVIHGARNLRVWAPLDWFWLNHNWHRIHHRWPTVSWLYLDRLGRRDPAPRGQLLWALLRMWRGPRLTTEHVQNRYAGRIIR